ncbi:MAG: thioredoxin domain-containing protein, partial [Gammaproteobacteria bacterium]
MRNELDRETSPYLLQHKDNPVHWQPWGTEVFDAAARNDKPILLSVGYAACHWCHVMAHESFEDDETAALMNQNFVCVKVDREERPDVDKIYMDALHALGEQGGWPLTMFIAPDGSPFWGGTYFPKDSRYGRA